MYFKLFTNIYPQLTLYVAHLLIYNIVKASNVAKTMVELSILPETEEEKTRLDNDYDSSGSATSQEEKSTDYSESGMTKRQ
jgi:hypothetical protein